MATVIASGLTKCYGGIPALDGVDLTLGEGELHGLLGPNGAGKTTLLRVLLGLIAPDSGTLELLGRPAGAAAREGLAGFVEEPSFYPYLSARANLEVLAELDGPGAREQIAGTLERCGLSARSEDRVAGYSSGMRQRLALAAALMRAPRLLVLDEPATGLDPEGSRQLAELLRELAGDGVSILLSSHLIGELEELCDGFTVLDRGRVAWSGSISELRAQAESSGFHLRTSDDERALALAADRPGPRLTRGGSGGLTVSAEQDELDELVLALAQEGVAVRRLDRSLEPLAEMFLKLTGRERPPAAGGAEPAP